MRKYRKEMKLTDVRDAERRMQRELRHNDGEWEEESDQDALIIRFPVDRRLDQMNP